MSSLQERQKYFKNRFDERKESSGEEKEWSYKVMIKCDKKIRDDFEDDLSALFKKYVKRTSDGYILKNDNLYMRGK
jgi:hypothetical protein